MEGLKSLGLPSKTSFGRTTTLKAKNTTNFETKSTLDVFKNYYSTLADKFLKKLSTPPYKYTFNFVIQYYRHFVQVDAFNLKYTTEINIEKILKSINVRKAASTDDPLRRSLKDGSRVLSKPRSELCNLSTRLENFPDTCRITKLSRYSKNGPKLTLQITDKYIYYLQSPESSKKLSMSKQLVYYLTMKFYFPNSIRILEKPLDRLMLHVFA